jgi:hypothetical protein
MNLETSLLNNLNNDDIKKRNKSTKSEKYEEERKILIDEISNIIELEKKEYILMSEIENNDILKYKIKNELESIKKYYRCSTWGYFISERNEPNSGNITSLIKQLYENTGYKIFSKQKKIEGIDKKVTVYYFNKN